MGIIAEGLLNANMLMSVSDIMPKDKMSAVVFGWVLCVIVGIVTTAVMMIINRRNKKK